MKKVARVFCRAGPTASLALRLLFDASVASADLLYTNPGTSTLRTDAAGYTVGMRFIVGSTPIDVTALGMWDKDGDGLLAAHDIGIWSDTGTLLTSATVPAGTGGTLVDGEFRFVNLGSPFTLDALTTYRLGALLAGGEPFWDANPTATYTTYVSSNPDSVYGGPGASLMFPATLNGVRGYLGPNLEFTPGAPPPPPPPPSGRLLTATAIAQSSQDGGRSMLKTTTGGELTGPVPDSPDGPFPAQIASFEDFWLSAGGADTNPFIVWDFGSLETVESVHVWNMDFTAPWYLLGTSSAEVYRSADNLTWDFVQTLTFDPVNNDSTDTGEHKTFDSPFAARYVKFEVANFPGAPDGRVGLSEVAFYAPLVVPEPAVALLLALGGVLIARLRMGHG